jgi:hypothetical protein
MGILIFILFVLFVTEWLLPVIIMIIPSWFIWQAVHGSTDAMVGLVFIALAFLPFTKFARDYLDRKNEPDNHSRF